MVAFPLFKLGFLAVKQISKPIANTLANRAKSSRVFREYICIPAAQLFHWCDVKVRMRILNLGKASKVQKLNEEKAIETGSQLLSDFIILSIAAGLIVFEYRRNSAKEEVRVAEIEREKAQLLSTVSRLEEAVRMQDSHIHELKDLVQNKRIGFFPTGSKASSSSSAAVKDVSYVEHQPEEEEVVVTAPEFHSFGPSNPPVRKGAITSAVDYFLEGCVES